MGCGGKTMGTLAEAMAPSTRSTGPGGVPGARGAGVGLHDRAVLGHVAQDAGPQRGDGQAQLQARAGDQRGVDGPDPVLAAVAEGAGQRVQVEDRAAAAAQLAPDPGQPEPGAGHQPGQVALAPAPGPAGLAPPLAAGVARPAPPRCPASTVDGVRGNGGRVPSVISWWISRPSAVPSRAPSQACLPNTCSVWVQASTSPSISFTRSSNSGERAGLGQDGGGDGAGRRGRDDVGGDPLHADQVLEHADLEGALGPAAGQHERGGSRGGAATSDDCGTARRRGQRRRQPPAAARHDLDQGAGAGGRGRPLRAWDDAAVDGDGHALGVVLGGQRGHEVGDGGAGAHLHRLAVHPQQRRSCGASASMSGATGSRPTRSTTAAAVSGASRMPLR